MNLGLRSSRGIWNSYAECVCVCNGLRWWWRGGGTKKRSRKLVKCLVPTSSNSCRSNGGANKNSHLERRIGSSYSIQTPSYVR